jgi:hypothetical protein
MLSETVRPKAFISYSWSSPGHHARVREWAERLLADGIDVTLDQFDLSEGQDKYAFMERMVSDATFTHVLVFSDRLYAEKADARVAGVGTESQIISKEIYDKSVQTEFVPIACEMGPTGEPYLPIFLRSRIWLDFSTPEATNENWERLLRHLYGQPLHPKPPIGTPPAFITHPVPPPATAVAAKWSLLRQALLNGRSTANLLRADFVAECVAAGDALRTRSQPNLERLSDTVYATYQALSPIRDVVVEWTKLESSFDPHDRFVECLVDLLEKLVSLKGRPAELQTFNEHWFDAHELFAYEVLLYVVATLLNAKAYKSLGTVFSHRYMVAEGGADGPGALRAFTCFAGGPAETLQKVLGPDRRYYSPAAETIKRNAQRGDVPFPQLMQADAMACLVSIVRGEARWYPHCLYYAGYGQPFPFFVRAADRAFFQNLARVAGTATGDDLRMRIQATAELFESERWPVFARTSLWDLVNLRNLDTL